MPYHLRFFFEVGVPYTPAWPDDVDGPHGSPCVLERLSISAATREELARLCEWYQSSIDWEYSSEGGMRVGGCFVVTWACGIATAQPGGGLGRAGLNTVSERKPYKTDLSDEQWAQIKPVITAWKAAHRSVSGHQGRYEMWEIVNALLHQGRTGCQWDLPMGNHIAVTAEGVGRYSRFGLGSQTLGDSPGPLAIFRVEEVGVGDHDLGGPGVEIAAQTGGDDVLGAGDQ